MMTRYLLYSLFILSLTCSSQNGLEKIKDFGSDPGKLDMFVHRPEHVVDTSRRRSRKPLVVVLHGCNQSANTMARETGWNKLADHFDFYVVYPEQSRLNNPSDCFNWYNEKDITRNSGESGSIMQMITYMKSHYGIDTSQIFVYGLSAGAAMTSVLLATYPEIFNAGAVLAGGPYKMAVGAIDGLSAMVKPRTRTAKEWGDLVRKENPNFKGDYPRLVIGHGKNDKVVDPKNSYELMKQWADLSGTDTIPSKTEKDFKASVEIEKKVYLDKKGTARIFYYEFDKVGHTLVIDPGDAITQGGKTGLFSVDKDFFSTYWIAKDLGLIK